MSAKLVQETENAGFPCDAYNLGARRWHGAVASGRSLRSRTKAYRATWRRENIRWQLAVTATMSCTTDETLTAGAQVTATLR